MSLGNATRWVTARSAFGPDDTESDESGALGWADYESVDPDTGQLVWFLPSWVAGTDPERLTDGYQPSPAQAGAGHLRLLVAATSPVQDISASIDGLRSAARYGDDVVRQNVMDSATGWWCGPWEMHYHMPGGYAVSGLEGVEVAAWAEVTFHDGSIEHPPVPSSQPQTGEPAMRQPSMIQPYVTAEAVDMEDPNGEGIAPGIKITVWIPPGEPGPLDTLARLWGVTGDALRATGHRHG